MLKAINIQYQSHTFNLDIPNFQLCDGEIFCLTGNSGSGKTILVKILQGKIKNKKFLITIDNKLLSKISDKKKLHYISSQKDIKKTNSDIKLKDFLYLHRRRIKSPFSFFNENDKEILNSLCIDLELNPYLNTKLAHLPKSIASIANIAAQLSFESEIAIFDNPSEYCDYLSNQKIRKVFRKYCAKGKRAILYTTNDLNFAILCADTIAIMNDGKICETGDYTIFTEESVLQYFKINASINKNTVNGLPSIQCFE